MGANKKLMGQLRRKQLYLAPKFPDHLAVVRIPPVRQHLTEKQAKL